MGESIITTPGGVDPWPGVNYIMNMDNQTFVSKVWVRGHHRKDPRTGKVIYVHGHWRELPHWKTTPEDEIALMKEKNPSANVQKDEDFGWRTLEARETEIKDVHVYPGHNPIDTMNFEDVDFKNVGLHHVNWEAITASDLFFIESGMRKADLDFDKWITGGIKDSVIDHTEITISNGEDMYFTGNVFKESALELNMLSWGTIEDNVFEGGGFNDYSLWIGDIIDNASFTVHDTDIQKNTFRNTSVYLMGTAFDDNRFEYNQGKSLRLEILGSWELNNNVFDENSIISVERADDIEHARGEQFVMYSYGNKYLGATLEGDWVGAEFSNDDMRGAILRGDFRGAQFKKVDLRGADLSNANLVGASFVNCIIDDTTKIPENYRKFMLGSDGANWEPDPTWKEAHNPPYNDPIFEKAARRYEVEAIKPLDGGTSPVYLVKLKGDGLAVQKNVVNRPEDFIRRPGESWEDFQWRMSIADHHNGAMEVIASTVAKLIGLEVYPDAVLTRDETGRQIVLSKFVDGATVFADHPLAWRIKDEEEDRMAQIQLLNFIMGNADMHEHNLLIDENNDIWIIDFGHARPSQANYYVHNTTNGPEIDLDRIGYTSFDIDKVEYLPDEIADRFLALTREEVARAVYKAFDDQISSIFVDNLWYNIKALQNYIRKHRI